MHDQTLMVPGNREKSKKPLHKYAAQMLRSGDYSSSEIFPTGSPRVMSLRILKTGGRSIV